MTKPRTQEIIINEEKCSGCQICQLICSYTYHEAFIPELAHISVSTHSVTPEISFLDSCTDCYECVHHCLYGALELREVSE